MRRPPPSQRWSAAEIRRRAQEAEYVGSREHKIGRWWGGQGRAVEAGGALRRPKKQLTTVCPLHTQADKRKATDWIREAIAQGCFLFVDGDKDFPKHVWRKDVEGQDWIGRCVNSVLGEYKGWPAGPGDIAALEDKKKQGA